MCVTGASNNIRLNKHSRDITIFYNELHTNSWINAGREWPLAPWVFGCQVVSTEWGERNLGLMEVSRD